MYLLNNPVQEAGSGVRFSGLYKNRGVLSELTGTYSRVPEKLIPTLRRLEQCTDFLRSYEGIL
jgi:hypothetical protein